MGITSDNVAEGYGVSRTDQDAFALSSHRKASKAQSEGLLEEEIVPMQLCNSPESQTSAYRDDEIRHEASMQALAKLKPVFANKESLTAGDSS